VGCGGPADGHGHVIDMTWGQVLAWQRNDRLSVIIRRERKLVADAGIKPADAERAASALELGLGALFPDSETPEAAETFGEAGVSHLLLKEYLRAELISVAFEG